VPLLANGLRATRDARATLKRLTTGDENARAEADFLLAIKERDFNEAVVRAAEVVVDPLADQETVVPGGTLTATVRVFTPHDSPAKIVGTEIKGPKGWTIAPRTETENEDGDNPFARFFRDTPTSAARFTVTVPQDAALTQPYFLDHPRDGDRYTWTAEDPKGIPFAPPLLFGEVILEVNGVRVPVNRPVQYRFADRVRGEIRRNINVVPPVSVGLDSRLLVVPVGGKNSQRVVVRITNHLAGGSSGTLRLRLPAGWTSEPSEAPFATKAPGDKMSAPFVVTVPAARKVGAFELRAEAAVNGQTYSTDLQEIAYPHIQTHRIYRPATAMVQVLDLKVAPVRVGYVMGSGDQVPDMIRRMGVPVTLIDDDMLATGDLAQFDTIVVGVRASEARPAFVANNGRLLQYAERGGTLIVQYQQGDYVQRGLAPLAAQMQSRVTDETAPVKILEPQHPVFRFPNTISASDFDGWVQERNLYAFTTFDKGYVPLLETADPGEQPQRGGEVYARVGKGHYVYTAYAWFRQLPGGVPGAYRQFANLISLSKAPVK